MEAEFRNLEEKIKTLILRVRELEQERDRLKTSIDELERRRESSAAKVADILDRLGKNPSET